MRDASHGSFPDYDWYDWILLHDGYEPGRLLDWVCHWVGFVIPALHCGFIGLLALIWIWRLLRAMNVLFGISCSHGILDSWCNSMSLKEAEAICFDAAFFSG